MLPAIKADGMRGLAVFISDIRNCKSKEAELKRINQELANIRNKFRSDRTLDGYQKKKYVCKLLFIFLLGHDIDFGHMEAVNLLSSNKYSEKQIGYLFISVLVNKDSDLIKLIVQSIKNDLASRNPVHVNLALQCIANTGSNEMTEAFFNDILKLLVSAESTDTVKQSAALCLLRLLRTSEDLLPGAEWTSRIVHLLTDQHLGVVTAGVSLLEALVKRNPDRYKSCISLVVAKLSRLVASSYTDLADYTYYFVPAPWLTVKLLHLLQNYSPPEDPEIRGKLNECLEIILIKAQEPPKSKKVQHSNAKNAVLFEAISLIIHCDNEPDLLVRACNQLGKFLSNRETNLRYLALESMSLLASSHMSRHAVNKHQEAVILSMKLERDVSVRQKAVDLLFAICDRNNAWKIVDEMLNYLETADYSIREEMVLKIAILAEKYASDYTWYVDTILNLIRLAGDYVSEQICYRIIQIVVNRDDLQAYAAQTVFDALQDSTCHENMVKVGGYILGEFGNLIAGDSRSSPKRQFHLLHSKFHLCSPMTRALLLTSYAKFINLFPDMKSIVQDVFRHHDNIRSVDAELQQRAIEYLQLSIISSADVLATVLEEMPCFPERKSSILPVLKKTTPGRTTQENDNLPPSVFVTPDIPPVSSTVDILLDVHDSAVSTDQVCTTQQQTLTNNPKNFACKNNGILYENDLLQVGFKCEFHQNLGSLSLFFGNKSSIPLLDFSSILINIAEWLPKLSLQAQPVEPILDVGLQIQQTINIECLDDYSGVPSMNISFTFDNHHQNIQLDLPIFINKFFEPTEMNAESFFTRWKKLEGTDPKKFQFIFNAIHDMETASIRAKLASFGMQLLNGIDPNEDNFVCAGIIHTKMHCIGCLLRLEPNRQAQMYRMNVRSSKDSVAQEILDILQHQF